MYSFFYELLINALGSDEYAKPLVDALGGLCCVDKVSTRC